MNPVQLNGFTIIRWLAEASGPVGNSGSSTVRASILRSARASASGSPASRAPSRSAWYSRDRLTDSCRSSAATGPSTSMVSPASTRRPPSGPRNPPARTKCAAPGDGNQAGLTLR